MIASAEQGPLSDTLHVMTRPPHPDDEWVEVTNFGDTEPRYLLGISGADQEIARACARYVEGQITSEEFEAVCDRVFFSERPA